MDIVVDNTSIVEEAPVKLYAFQCFHCKKFGKGTGIRVWEKQVMYDKIPGELQEREGEMVWCEKCYKGLK